MLRHFIRSFFETNCWRFLFALVLCQGSLMAQADRTEDAQLIANPKEGNAFLGGSSAVSGDTVLVGARGALGTKGAAYVFVRNGSGWIQQARLTAGDGVGGHYFGGRVALDGDTALVGTQAGEAAYVFVRNGSIWTQQQKLTQGGALGFGEADVALYGDTAVVGATGTSGGAGAAYVYVRSGMTWTLQQTLTASDSAAGAKFGSGLGFDGTTLMVGSQSANGGTGVAYVFTYNGSDWTERQKIWASDSTSNFGIGLAVAVSGDTAVIGQSSEGAYVFVRSGTTWSQQAKLVSNDPQSGGFGISTALVGDTALVGAWTTFPEGISYAGAAYVFTRAGATWTKQERLTASDKAHTSYFGASVAMDGVTAVVGSVNAGPGGTGGAGEAYVFEFGVPNVSPTFVGATTEFSVLPDASATDITALLHVSDSDSGQTLTWTQSSGPSKGSLSFSGATASSGGTDIAPGGTITYTPTAGQTGADSFTVQVSDAAATATRTLSVSITREIAKLIAGDKAQSDHLGGSVAVSGDTVLVGAANVQSDEGVPYVGAAYVYVRDGNGWTEQAKLTASDGVQYDYFGARVALYGNTALVGSLGEAAYIFVRNGSTWTQQAKLTEPGAAYFGQSVALHGDTAMVGAYSSGEVYVYGRSGTVWTLQQTLTPNEPSAGFRFGVGLGFDGTTLIVGAQSANVPGLVNAGAAYVFEYNGSIWEEKDKFWSGDQNSNFGIANGIAVSGDTAVIGQWQEGAYVFVRSGTTWSQQQKLLPDDPVSNHFGISTALVGDTALVGAYTASPDGVGSAGAVYVFKRTDGVWSKQERLSASDKTQNAGFGSTVAMDGGTVVVGAPGARPDGTSEAGEAYVFEFGILNIPVAVVAWGDNSQGQLAAPAGLSGVTAIVAGGDFTVALKNDGTVVAWGANADGQTTVPAELSGVTAIAAGLRHTVALKNDGTVVAWGYNDFGQATVPAELSGVTAIAAGLLHTVALRNDGTVVAWGGTGTPFGLTTVPAELSGVTTAIAAGLLHTVALKNDGTVVAWGVNSSGQTTVPAGLSGVTAIAAGRDFTVALKNDGTVVAWGDNSWSQATVPLGLNGVIAIAAGQYHTVALKNDGTILAWGANYSGQTTVPAELRGATAITAGDSHTVALVPAPVLGAITPDEVVGAGGAADLTLNLQGSGFTTFSVVRWNGNPLTTTFVNSATLTAQILGGYLPATDGIITSLVTVVNPGGAESFPKPFTIKAANVGKSQTVVSAPGETVVSQVLPLAPGEAGVSASFTNQTPGSSPATVTTAVYTSNPVAGTTIEMDGGFVDLQITGADSSDVATVNFYYSSSVMGASETALVLRYFDGANWQLLQSSGGFTPIKNTTDDLDGTVSGGRFTVLFNNTSTPKITELSGTVIAMSINGAPVANPDSYAVSQDGLLEIAAPGVVGNDTDPENDALQAILVSGPNHGLLALQANGSFTYTPQAYHNGPDSFSYKASDTAADSNATSVSITVTPAVVDAVSWWRAENDATDSKDGNDGTLLNGAGFAPGLVGQAFSLNGFNQRITVPNAANFQFGTSIDFTIEGWIKLNGSQNNYAGIFANETTGAKGYQLLLLNNKLVAGIDNAPAFAQGLLGTTDMNDGAWHHVAMVVTRSTLNAKLYVDGVVEADVTDPVIGSDLSNSANIHIGSERFGVPGSNPFFKGNIDEITLYARALSASEIEAVHAAGSAGKPDPCILDNTPPIALAKDITIQLDATGSASITGADIDNGSSDFCGIADLSVDVTSFSCANLGANPVILTVTDNSGNVATATATVTVEDNAPPSVLAQNITVQLDGSGNASITANDVDAGSNDPCGIASLSVAPNAFTCANTGANTVTLTVTDTNGNVATETATVTVEDTVPPIALAHGLTVLLDASGNAFINPAAIDNGSTDNCGIQSVGLDISAFTCANVGPNTVTLIVTDLSGNVSTATATVIVVDAIAPIAQARDITVQLDAAGQATISAKQVDNGSHDACGIASLGLDVTAFTCSNVGPNPVVLTVTDASGNVSTASAVVTVEDNVAPVAVAQDITVQLDAAGQATITAAQFDGGSTDACGIASLELDVTDFTCSNVGLNTVRLTATDVNGNVSTTKAVVTVEDNVAPAVLAQDITVQLDASGNVSVTAAQIDNGSNDACGIALLRLDVASFTCANVGPNTVTLTAIDVNGNSASAAATVTVVDSVAPAVVVQSITVLLDPAGNATINASAIDNGTTDACGIASLNLDVSSFTCANIGPNTVLLTATDVNGNRASASATVTVEDNVAPVAITHDIAVQLDTAGQATIAAKQIDNGSNDACGIASLELDVMAFTCSNVGPNPVVLTVTDVNGNVSTANAVVTVEDNVAPVAIAQDITVQLDAAGQATITAAQFDGGSTDACGIASLELDVTAFTCSNVGLNTVRLTVTDVNGNVSTTKAVVTVEDKEAPIALAQDITVQLDASGNVSITAAQIDDGSNDACGIAGLSLDVSSFTCANVGPNTVTLTATDVNGNSASATAVVTVQDTVAPVVLVNNITIELDAAGNASIDLSDIDAGSTDACGIDTRSLSKTSFDCADLGANIVTLTVTDVNGNTASADATVRVIDVTPPSLVLNGAEEITLFKGDTYVELSAVATDTCDPDVPVVIGGDTVNTGVVGVYVVTYDATDDSGNAAVQLIRTVVVLPRFAIADAAFGSEELKLEEGVKITGSVGSQNKVDLHKASAVAGNAFNVTGKVDLKEEVQVTGSVEAGGHVHLHKQAQVGSNVVSGKNVDLKEDTTVAGDVTAAGKVKLHKNTTVLGVITEKAVVPPLPDVPLPILDLSAGGPNVKVEKNKVETLPPGSYGKLEMKENSTLNLQAGVYDIESLKVDKGSVIAIDLSVGTLNLNITGDVDLKENVVMTAAGGGASDILIQVQGKHVKYGKSGSYLGTVLAPQAHIDVAEGASLVGALYGEKVQVKKEVILQAEPANDLLIGASLAWLDDDDGQKGKKGKKSLLPSLIHLEVPVMEIMATKNGLPVIRITGNVGFKGELLASDTLIGGDWETLAELELTKEFSEYIDESALNTTTRFYRIINLEALLEPEPSSNEDR